MQAVILAGGRGARLGSITGEIPKPMVRVGDKPILQHQVEWLARYGVTDIHLLVHYLKQPIIEYFGDGSAFDVAIRYHEEAFPLGTAGSVREIAGMLKEDFLLLYGDVMVRMDLRRFIDFHAEKDSQCTLVLHPNDHPADSDLVESEASGRVVAFHPKPHDTAVFYHNLVNAGAYIMSPDVLRFVEKGVKTDFGRQVFPNIYQKVKMFGYITSEYLKDMGTQERLEKVEYDLATGLVSRKSYENVQKAIFLDRDGVLNMERNYISSPDQLTIYPFAFEAVKKINQSGYLAVVVTNQPVVARNLCTLDELERIHKKLETRLGEHEAWLDAIYYCPHHPDKGYPGENPEYKINCDCRKPKTGMFRQAIGKFNISAGDSFMVGDSERDILAGRNAGCITIGVRTGHGLKKSTVMPEYFFRDLAEAVDFIVDDPYDSAFGEIYGHFARVARENKPFVLLIGGNTRSGKSTLAAYLSHRFMKKGIRAGVVQLDNWLLPEERRSPSMNVHDRFRLPQIEKDIKRLLQGEDLSLTTYANHHERVPMPVKYSIRNNQVLIVEGVVALSSKKIRQMAGLRIYADILEPELYARFGEYYAWRGKSREEVEKLYEKRKSDEYRIIEKERNFADLVINSNHT